MKIGREREKADAFVHQPEKARGSDLAVELVSVVPIMSELGNGHLGELLSSLALLHANNEKGLHASVFVVNNSKTALFAYLMTSKYRLQEVSAAIHRDIDEFRRNLNECPDRNDPIASEVAKKLVLLSTDELERWLIEERTIYEENQLTLKLLEIITSTQAKIRRSNLSYPEKTKVVKWRLIQLQQAWEELYPETKLPFGFELALRRMVKIRVVDLSSEKNALETRCMGLVRQTGIDSARSEFPNLKSIHSRDADTLSHDDWWKFIWEHWEVLQNRILTIPQLSRVKEPEVIESSIQQSVGSVMIDQILALFQIRLEKYLNIYTHRLGGSQLMVPAQYFDAISYSDKDMNEDFDFALKALGHFSTKRNVYPVLWPQLILLLYNRSRPTSYDGRSFQSKNWFQGDKDSRDVLVMQDYIFNKWKDKFLEQYAKLKIIEASSNGLSILEGKKLEEWYQKAALVAIDQLRKEQSRIKKTVHTIVKAMAKSRAEHGRVDKQLIITSLRPRYRSIVEANPKIFSYFLEIIETLKLATEEEMLKQVYNLFGDLLEPVPADFLPPKPLEVEGLTIDREDFALNTYAYLPIVTALMGGIEWRAEIEQRYGIS